MHFSPFPLFINEIGLSLTPSCRPECSVPAAARACSRCCASRPPGAESL